MQALPVIGRIGIDRFEQRREIPVDANIVDVGIGRKVRLLHFFDKSIVAEPAESLGGTGSRTEGGGILVNMGSDRGGVEYICEYL